MARYIEGAENCPSRIGSITPIGAKGNPGKSAYQVAVDNGFAGTEAEWLASLKGEKGEQGERGLRGATGAKGDKGDKGDPGEIEPATSTTLGGIYADAKTVNDTQPVRLGEDGKLYTAPGGGIGTSDHRNLTHRNDAGQHSIGAITGLQEALDGKLPLSAGADYPITGDLYMAVGSSKRIRRLGNPQSDYDASNKRYVDEAIRVSIGDTASALSSLDNTLDGLDALIGGDSE